MRSFDKPAQYGPYISHLFRLAQSIPNKTDTGIIITSVDSIFKHSFHFNSLVKYKDPIQNKSNQFKEQLYNTVPRIKKFPKRSLDQPIFDGTINFFAQKNQISFSYYPLNMMYLFQTIKYAKIVLVINQASTKDTMLQKIKDTFFRFVQSFSKQRLPQIIKSVGIMVVDSTINEPNRNPDQIYIKRIKQLLSIKLDHSREKIILDMLKEIIENKKIISIKKKPDITDQQRDVFATLCSNLSKFETENAMFIDENVQNPNSSIQQRNKYFKTLFWVKLQEVIDKTILRTVILRINQIINPRMRQGAFQQILQILDKQLQVDSVTPGQQQESMVMNYKKENKMSFVSELKHTRETQRLIKFYLKMQELTQRYNESQQKSKIEKNLFHSFFEIFFNAQYISNKNFQRIIREIYILQTKMKKFQYNVLVNTIFRFFEKNLSQLVRKIQESLDQQIVKFQIKKKSPIAYHLSIIVDKFIQKLKRNPSSSKRLIEKMYRRKVLIDLEKIKFEISNQALFTLIQCQFNSRQCGLFQDQFKSKHFCKIYQKIGDCLVSQKKYNQALKCYDISNSHWKIRTLLYQKLQINNFYNFKISKFSFDQFTTCIDWLMCLGLQQQARKLCYVCIEVFEQQRESFTQKLNQISKNTKIKHLQYLAKVAKNDNPMIERDTLQNIKIRAQNELDKQKKPLIMY